MGVANVRTGRTRANSGRKKVDHDFLNPLDKALPREVIWDNVSEIFDASRSLRNRCFVYAIGEADDGPLKIGKAKDPISRLRTMQTGNPRRLRIEAIIVGARHIEKLLQEIWEEHAIRSIRQESKVDAPPGTEWFKTEVREKLIPVLLTAAVMQSDFLRDCSERKADIDEQDLERIVREAHGFHKVAAYKRHETILLGRTTGYGTPRQSLI